MTTMTFAAASLTGFGQRVELRDQLVTLTNVCRSAGNDPAFLRLFAEAIKEAAIEAREQGVRSAQPFLVEMASTLQDFISRVAISTADHVRMINAYIQAITLLVTNRSN